MIVTRRTDESQCVDAGESVAFADNGYLRLGEEGIDIALVRREANRAKCATRRIWRFNALIETISQILVARRQADIATRKCKQLTIQYFARIKQVVPALAAELAVRNSVDHADVRGSGEIVEIHRRLRI